MSEYGPILTLAALIAGSLWVGHLAQLSVGKGAFLKQFFLGGRGLGAWALALTATVQSGGTFMGFPSLVYSYGWIVGLWIAAYMVVPITGFGVLAKRLSQLSRRTGAITVPDLYRERFDSPAVGLVASMLVLLFISFMMTAQFKAGASLMKVVWPGANLSAATEAIPPTIAATAPLPGGWTIDRPYLTGLIVFAVTVVAYTMMGGFLAAVWTDLFQSILMFVGVVCLLYLALNAVPSLEAASRAAVANTGDGFVSGPGFSPDQRQFLTPALAASYFVVWIFGGLGQPASQVRLMACKDAATIRRSMVLLSGYNMCVYLPLIVICVIGRSLIPHLDQPDEIIPRLTVHLTRDVPLGGFVTGLILAAPFGAVMATVSSFLVIIASAFVRDVYNRFLWPHASDAELRRMTHLCMLLIGAVCVAVNIYPVKFLQAIIVFCSSGVAAAFFVPALMVAFWRRATAAGMIAAMLAGTVAEIVLLLAGIFSEDSMLGPKTAFRSYYLWGLEPVVWGVISSAVAGVLVSYGTTPPPAELISRMFDRGVPVPQHVVAPASGDRPRREES
jgi:SSS family solute:Na+ symporter/sodium/pantothenate symporter